MRFLISMFLALAISLVFSPEIRAEMVGRLIQVEGPVDLLKQGKMPARDAKVDEGVEPGDVIRTKTGGRAQVKFVDDSIITIAPGSRVGIETFLYDAAKGKRQGVLQVFRGMVQAVVTRILKTEEPDFIMKTHTAVLGVRGTKWYAVLAPTTTDVYNEIGELEVYNLFPEIVGKVILKAMEFTRVMPFLPPTLPFAFLKQDLAPLQRQLSTGVQESKGESAPPPGSLLGGTTSLATVGRLPGVLTSLENPVIDPRSSIGVITPSVPPNPTPPPNPKPPLPPHPPR